MPAIRRLPRSAAFGARHVSSLIQRRRQDAWRKKMAAALDRAPLSDQRESASHPANDDRRAAPGNGRD